MWESTIFAALFICIFAVLLTYILSIVTFMSELMKEARTWEDTLWSKGSMFFLILVGLVPIVNTVLAIKACIFRAKEEKLSNTLYKHEEEVKNDNELN